MEIAWRILALAIDLAASWGSLFLVMVGTGLVLSKLSWVGPPLLPLWYVLLFVWPVLCFAIPTGLWGKTLGKLICGLTVRDLRGNPPGISRALGREFLKCLAIGSGLGALLALLQIVYQGRAWYDQLCGTRVQFGPRVPPTQAQQN